MAQVISKFNRGNYIQPQDNLQRFLRHKNYGGSLVQDSKGTYKTTQLIECKESLGELLKGQTYHCLRGSSNFDKAQFKNIKSSTKVIFVGDYLVKKGLDERDLILI